MRYYTGKGDHGGTDLLGERVDKSDPRIDLLGALDETTSAIGLGRALAGQEQTKTLLVEAQRDLYAMMAELAFTDALRPDAYRFPAERSDWLTAETDRLAAGIELPPHFILPGETAPSAALDVARTVARRAERVAVGLARADQMRNPEILRYLNRLSSLLFLLARVEEAGGGAAPVRAKRDPGAAPS